MKYSEEFKELLTSTAIAVQRFNKDITRDKIVAFAKMREYMIETVVEGEMSDAVIEEAFSRIFSKAEELGLTETELLVLYITVLSND